jgi:hypothetical protein
LREWVLRVLEELWKPMGRGEFSAALASDVLRFNGMLFKDRHALPGAQVALLQAGGVAGGLKTGGANGTGLARRLEIRPYTHELSWIFTGSG